MKRKYKLLIIILMSALLTYLIYFFTLDDKIRFVALGDGVSSGETAYDVDGISYNDYIKEYLEDKNLLKDFSNDFAFKNFKLKELNLNIDNNYSLSKEITLNQILNQSDIITISIGVEELVKSTITNDISIEYIKEFSNEYEMLLKKLKRISDAKIFIIGFYENKYLNKSNVIILNSTLKNLAQNYAMIYIDISRLMLNNEFINKNDYYFNYKGHKAISEMIINLL